MNSLDDAETSTSFNIIDHGWPAGKHNFNSSYGRLSLNCLITVKCFCSLLFTFTVTMFLFVYAVPFALISLDIKVVKYEIFKILTDF